MNEDVRSLQQAQELLSREWPGRDATPAAWLAHHRRAAELYAHVAEVDQGHHYEALHWAACARDEARAFSELLSKADEEKVGGSHGPR